MYAPEKGAMTELIDDDISKRLAQVPLHHAQESHQPSLTLRLFDRFVIRDSFFNSLWRVG